MVSIKYSFIVLAADVWHSESGFFFVTANPKQDDGEGGTFALYSLLARYARIVRRDPNVGATRIERHLTGDMRPVNKGVRSFLENSRFAQTSLKFLGVLGVSMVMR
jgi:KUP system potassium uptake protein